MKLKFVRRVCGGSIFHLCATVALMAVGAADGAAAAVDEDPSEQQWVGVWTGVDDETDGRFHGRSVVDFRISAGAAGLEFQDLDRMRGSRWRR